MGIFTATSSQKNFLNNLALSENTLWNQGVVFCYDKVYNYEQLNEVFNNLISYFDWLRLTLVKNDNDFLIKTNDFEPVSYPLLTLEAEKSLILEAEKILSEQYDVGKALFKSCIFQTPEKSGFIISAHHLIIDGFSTQIMADFFDKHITTSAEEKVCCETYEQYLLNDRKYRSSRRYNVDKSFWLEQFSDELTYNVFEGKKTSFDYASDEVNFDVPKKLFGKIKRLCNSVDISVQTFFNSAYAAYIFRSLGTKRFTIGVPVLNRTTQAELSTIGLYMHIVPLVINVSDGSFLQNALEIEDGQMTLFRHQKFTQHDIKELLKEEGKLQSSLFDIAADYQEFSENDGYKFEFIYSNSLSVPVEIHMQSFGEEKHNLKIRYRTAMFTEKEIQTMLNSFIALIEDAVENPHKKISQLNMLTDEEKQKVLYGFNDTAVEYDKDTCVYNLFSQQVRNNPSKTAVVFKKKKLSYAELDELVNAYADKLVQLGVNKGDVVAVHLERSHRLIALQLAVLKTGAVFLPLDKRYPSERIRYACDNCKVALLITDEKIKTDINSTVIEVSDFEAITTILTAQTVVNTGSCYIIYTSGSTGKPKGCLLTGRGLLNFCKNNNTLETLDKIGDCVFACVNSVSFDYFIAESLLPLTNGFTTVVLDEKESTLQRLFSEAVVNNGINVVMTTPTRLKIYFSDNPDADALAHLKCICTSGEPLTAELLSQMYEKSPYAKVYNPIGPSECSVWDIGGELNREDGLDIHIGKPVANVQIYITDKYLNPVPIGVTGEICIGGDGVGAGYINSPELTKEKFVDNPFGEGRLYKTGDLAYWREDGNIVFVGRNDFQVKIRGLRIELGEIESAVAGVGGVELAVAVVRRDKNGEQYICAFYTGEEKAASDIKAEIKKKLPSYMLPNAYVHLKEMPLTSSGKINRSALPEMSFIKEADFEEPINDAEKLACEAFKRALGLKKVGRESDFFELGGTSLSMISLLSKEGFENITSAEFVHNSTPEKLALLLNKCEVKELEYLEILHTAEKEKKALVLFPFGGGGAEGFGSLVNEIKHKHNNVSVYFVRYLHSVAECEGAAEEIESIFRDTETIFYSHCAGAAVAMNILKKLERDGFAAAHYFAGAIIPAATKSGKSIWDIFPDSVIKKAFVKAGAGFDGIADKAKNEIVSRFRRDTDFAYKTFFEADSRFVTPVTVIISKKDIFTLNYKQTEKQWKKFAENLHGVKFIDAKSHYFQSENAEELTDILFG